MGSISGTVGADGGVRIPPLDAPTPQFKANAAWAITSVPDPNGNNYLDTWTTTGGYVYVPFEYGWRAFSFQLVVVVSGNGTVTVQAINAPTGAQNIPGGGGPSGAAWETIISASGAVFPNPLTVNGSAGPRLLYVNSGPWTAFRFTTGGAFPGSVVSYMLFGAAS